VWPSKVNYLRTQSPRLAEYLLLYSRVSYCYYNNQPVLVMSYSIPRLSRKTPVLVRTIQWVANPLVPIRYTVYRTVLLICVLKIVE
jgi:hypothetical protein